MATVLEPKLARELPESSDRSFGLLFAAVFAAIGCLPLLHGEIPRWWSFAVAIAFGGAAVIRPRVLHQLNRAWLALGRLLHRIVSPVVMGAIFFLFVTPLAWIVRWQGKNLLSLSRRPDLSSYWIARRPPPPATESMKQQF